MQLETCFFKIFRQTDRIHPKMVTSTATNNQTQKRCMIQSSDQEAQNGLMISGMHLQQYHSSQRLSFSYMLVWMPWTLINGKAAMQGNFTTFLFIFDFRAHS